MRTALSFAVAAIALGAGLASLASWVAGGTAPGARGWLDVWPLLALASLAAVSAGAAVRRATAPEWALGLLAWTLSARVAAELPPIASAHWLNDGPALVPAYLLLGAAFGLYAAAGPRAHGFEGRAAAALAFAFTSNGKLWTREPDVGFGLLAAGALLLLGAAERRRDARELFRGGARLLAWIVAAFLAWTLAASLLGDAPPRSAIVFGRCLMGALLALALSSTLDVRGAQRVHAALLAGLAASLVLLAIGLCESASFAGWSEVLRARLRLFDQHANGIGPLFSMGLALALAPLLFPGSSRQHRLLGAALALPCALALWRTESRASVLGALLGLLALCWFRTSRLPRRPLRLGAALVLLAAAAVGTLVSPAGAPARAWLDAQAQGPSAWGQRWHFWRMAAAAAAERPLLGWGPNTPWVHAQYAAPSYYDGTPQDLHAHDLFLAVAESTGWIGLALFALLVLGALEACRRALLRAPGAEVAGIAAALIALLGCNLLDLGQSQTSFVPSFLWLALGVAAAAARRSAPEAHSAGAARPAAALVLLVFLSAHPIAVRLMAEEGVRRSRSAPSGFEGEPPGALAFLDLALSLAPWDVDALRERAELRQREVRAGAASGGAAALALGDFERIAHGAPTRARAWESLADSAIELGRPAIALEALGRAEQLDPRGETRGERSLLLAHAHLRAGRRVLALDALVEGIARGGADLTSLPNATLPPRPGDPPGARRLAFVLGSSGENPIPLTLALDRVVDRAVEAAAEPVRARRLLGRALATYAAVGLTAEAAAALARYESAGGQRIPSTEANLLPVLVGAGQVDAARAALFAAGTPDPRVAAAYAAALLDPRVELDPARRAELLDEVEPHVLAEPLRDLFFDAGAATVLHDARARLALRRGDEPAALAHHRAARFDRRSPFERVSADQAFLRELVAAGGSEAALAAALDALLRDCSTSARLARDEPAMQERAAWLDAAGVGAGVIEHLDEHGAASASFLRAWERVAGP